jgi:serine/threonine-protein kinase
VSDLPDFEPYLPLRRLTQGPSYELYLARHRSLERQVWIKALRSEVPLSSSVARRLEREAEILARLAHPNILGLLDCARRPPRLWLVLEAVDGWSLSEVLSALRRGGTAALEIQGAIALTLQIARALAHSHQAGVVHGAVQPAHILISKQGVGKLSGFSLALELEGPPQADPVETEPGTFEPGYLSPEQVLGERIDEQSDQFSLGVVLYELLTGRHPFAGSNERATAHDIRHRAPEPLRELNAEISPELERVVQRCLEKPRERRFDSLGQLLRALEHLLGPQAVADLPPLVARALAAGGLVVSSPAPVTRLRADEQERREARRGLRRSLFGLLGVSASLLVGGALLSAWLETKHPAPQAAAQLWTAENGAELSVVADPWAHVFVDGELLETTPFAIPLRLSPGQHFVRLEHPNAPPERRTVDLIAGQRVLLEVTMQMERTPDPDGTGEARPPDAGLVSP